MHRSVLVCVTLVLLVATVGASAPLAAESTPDDRATASPSTLTPAQTSSLQDDGPGSESMTAQEFDSTTFEITVHENGTATWTFRYERILSSQSEEEEFEQFAREFEEEETDLYNRFTNQSTALTQTGADKTDREMEATNFQRRSTIEHRPNAMGVVEMSFTWKNFAVVDEDGTVTVGDVFAGGLYIGSNQRLEIMSGDDLVFGTVQPPPSDQSGTTLETSNWVSWDGEREFLDGQPRVVLEPASEVENGDDNETGGADNAGDESAATTDGDGSPWLLAAGLLVAVLGLGAVFAWRRFGDPGPGGGGAGPFGSGEPPTDGSGGPITGASTVGESDDPPDPDPIPEEELMTDEDRVVSLIQENGGRMKQVNIVEQTGWSKSKVSMLLSDMEDDGTISKLRVGRENIISLDGFEPEATKSPFEE